MAPRTRKATANSDPPTESGTAPKKRERWNDTEIQALIKSVIDQKPSAEGKGGNFKKKVFKNAAVGVGAAVTPGHPPKTVKQCSTKFYELKKDWEAVTLIKEQSGFGVFTVDHGAGITVETEHVWEAFVRQHPQCAKFKNKGPWWYDSLTPVMPSKAKGSHIFQASNPASAAPEEPGTDNPQQDQGNDEHEGSPTVWDDSAMEPGYDDTGDEIQTSHESPVVPEVDSTSQPSMVAPPPPPAVPSLKRPATMSTPSSAKKPRSSLGSMALDRIANQATEFNITFRQAMGGPAMAQPPAIERTPARMAKAVSKVLKKEKGWLTPSQMNQLLTLLEQRVMVDMYLGVSASEDEEDRKNWVRMKLGIPVDDFSFLD